MFAATGVNVWVSVCWVWNMSSTQFHCADRPTNIFIPKVSNSVGNFSRFPEFCCLVSEDLTCSILEFFQEKKSNCLCYSVRAGGKTNCLCYSAWGGGKSNCLCHSARADGKIIFKIIGQSFDFKMFKVIETIITVTIALIDMQ